MNMLKNGGMAIMPEFQFQPNNRGTYITGGTSLDFKLAKLRNEMVSLTDLSSLDQPRWEKESWQKLILLSGYCSMVQKKPQTP